MSEVRITHIGGPTVLIEVDGWTILSDPTFDPPGRTYKFGWGTSSRKLAGPAVAVADLPPIDVVLLSHDNHADNLDDAGRALLPAATTVVTTPLAATRLGGRGDAASTRGARPWSRPRVVRTSRSPRPRAGTGRRSAGPSSAMSTGFALAWEGQADGVLWISGDTVLYDGVREVAERLDVDVALLHLGDVKFGITGPVHYSMTAKEAVELTALVRPRVAIPVHFEGWSHFHEGRDTIDQVLSATPAPVRERFQLIEIGTPVVLTM